MSVIKKTARSPVIGPADSPLKESGAALWTPAQITTEGWYDASDAATITESGGGVSQWDDKSGNARHLTQGTGSLQLTTGLRTINALNALDGDGTEYINRTSYPVNADGDLSVFGVHEIDSVSYFSEGIYAMDGAGADFKFSAGKSGDVSGDFNGFIQGGFGTNLVFNDGPAPGPFPGPSIYNAEFDKTGSALVTGRVDGTDRKSETYNTNLVTSMNFTVMADKAGIYKIDGAVGEIVVIHDDLSLATRQLIEGYLAWKWGTVANLPGAHPYKNAAPTV